MKIDWSSNASHILINPAYSLAQKQLFQSILSQSVEYSGHIWLSTSGSTSQKWVGLSKTALLVSAQAVNEHLQSDQKDRWINVLPDFHVGGLGIWTRAHLSAASVHDYKISYENKWNARNFYAYLIEKKGTLLSLVPTQLYDIIELGLIAPTHLRAVIVGGGALSANLYEKGCALKWPLLPSYGLSECSSQVATAALGSWSDGYFPQLKILPHLQVKEKEGLLHFKGSSLLSIYAYFQQDQIIHTDPKVDGWFASQDRGAVNSSHLMIYGREDSLIKIRGEQVDSARLELLLQQLKRAFIEIKDATLLALPDSRLGHQLCLIVVSQCAHSINQLVQQFYLSVLPFERLTSICLLSHIPRSDLGKIFKEKLKSLVADRGVTALNKSFPYF